jgi:hypothetical protein
MVYEDAIMREAKRRSLQPNRVVSSPIDNQRWDQKAGDTGKKYLMGIGGGFQRGLDALTEGVAMHNENTRWFKENAPNAPRYAGVPMGVRKSVMTGRDTDFFNKYTKLAEMEQDRKRKQFYLDQADTARRNLQVTKRINYGLGQMDLDETPFKGYESYDPGFAGFEGETGPRFDIDRFSEAMSEYLPGGEEITESVTEDFVPYDVDTGYEWDEDIVEDEPLDFDWTDLWMKDQEDDLLGEEKDITETLEEIIEEPEETTETFTDLGDTHDFTEEFGWGAGDYEDVQEYVTDLVGDPDSTWYKMDQDELVKILIKQNRIKEK